MSRIASADVRPGDIAVYRDGTKSTIGERKTASDAYPWPGWWLVGGGGLADRAIDDPHGGWTIMRPYKDSIALLRRVLSEYVAGNRIVDGYWYSPERGTSSDLPPAADVLAWIHSHDHGEVAYPTDHTYRVIVVATLAAIEALSLPSDESGAPHYRNDPATADEVALIESLRTEVGL